MENKLIKRETAGGVVMNESGDILLVQQKGKGFWTFPKGGIDKKTEETALSAAKREIWEESGIEEKDLEQIEDFVETYDRPDTEKENVMQIISMFVFKTKKIGLNIPPEFQSEIGEARWVKRDEVANLLAAPKDKEFFLRLLDLLPEMLEEIRSEINNERVS